MHSQTWTPLPPPSPWHLSGSLPCTSPKHAVSCFGHRLAIWFLHDSIHVRMPFSQIIPPSPSPSESKSPLYTSASFLLSCIQGRHCHLSIELPYDPAIPLLSIHTEETRIERDTCTPMFITALFIIARTWKQPRCPSADEWIRKLWYIYTMQYYSAIKKNTFFKNK